MSDSGIVLYRAIASRAYPVLWMLEELGLSWRDEIIQWNAERSPALMKVNPTGKVPALTDGAAAVSEAPAICLYLADRYGYGSLAPKFDDPARGPYLKWMIYSTSVLEAARETQSSTIVPTKNDWGVGWPRFERVVEDLAAALTGHDYIAGDRFTAADVMLGSVISISLFCETIPAKPALVAYSERLKARPACQRAEALNWPPAFLAERGTA